MGFRRVQVGHSHSTFLASGLGGESISVRSMTSGFGIGFAFGLGGRAPDCDIGAGADFGSEVDDKGDVLDGPATVFIGLAVDSPGMISSGPPTVIGDFN